MRLHRLTVSAFGPFAGTEHVDFDELNTAGLFLLTGATGAGKSSLLDAVCFALYGTVPGARGVKALRSQHARPDAQPHVVLDFSVQGRRFVVRRTPEWSRPKRRGDGMLTEKASALITETTGGDDHFLSSRAAEVGLLVGELMGMNAAQFAQVALLPQGEFQTFLRASSQDRHDVLQQLFRTDRFAAIEEFVSDHSRRLRDQAAAGASTVQRILDTLADRAEADLPADLSGEALPAAAADGQVLPWVGAVQEAAAARAEHARVAHRDAVDALDTLRRRHQQLAARADGRRRVEQAEDALLALEASEDMARSARDAVSADDRASRCRPVLALLGQQAAARADAAGHAAATFRAVPSRSPAFGSALRAGLGAGPLPESSCATDLAGLAQTIRARAGRLRSLVPREQAAHRLRREQEVERRLLQDAEADQRVVAVRAAEIPGELIAGSARLDAVAMLAARREALALGRDAAAARQTAAAELAVLRERLVELEDRRRDARDLAQDARGRVQALMTRRLAGMAAELAGALTPGSPCTVCGGLDHPRPARTPGDAVTLADQEAAADELLRLETRVDTADAALHTLRSRHEKVAAATGGRSHDDATADLDASEAALTEATAAVHEKRTLEAEVTTLRAEQDTLAGRRLAATAVVAGLRQAVAARERSVAEIEHELEDALEPGHDRSAASPRPDLRASAAALEALLELLTDAQRTRAALEDADVRLRSLTQQAVEVADEQGFAGLAEVEAAVLPDLTRLRSLALLEDRSAAQARARAVLEDPTLRPVDDPDAADTSSTDLDRLVTLVTDRLKVAEDVADGAARRLALEDDRAAALALLAGRLAAAVQEWAPVRDDALRADGLSRLVRGMGQDNQLQMRLSAYVLATRLDQVVAAANERLGHMRDQRYLLQRTGRAERRTSQAGLGLEVVDQWTGDVRAPATLSGGETFVVSLSLALGLADVVTQESGGTEIETLFVDEGFGTLDADTLDDVMDRLDGLRAGGRTVGVVSHVTELRSRIPTQVQVEKGRSGSTVTVRTLVG